MRKGLKASGSRCQVDHRWTPLLVRWHMALHILVDGAITLQTIDIVCRVVLLTPCPATSISSNVLCGVIPVVLQSSKLQSTQCLLSFDFFQDLKVV